MVTPENCWKKGVEWERRRQVTSLLRTTISDQRSYASIRGLFLCEDMSAGFSGLRIQDRKWAVKAHSTNLKIRGV
jgi:hypothetical protein